MLAQVRLSLRGTRNTSALATHPAAKVSAPQVKTHRSQLHEAVCRLHRSCCSPGTHLSPLENNRNVHQFMKIRKMSLHSDMRPHGPQNP